ncbi:MAG: hypothetical protein C4290_08195 [Chloroflexota bacterium]
MMRALALSIAVRRRHSRRLAPRARAVSGDHGDGALREGVGHRLHHVLVCADHRHATQRVCALNVQRYEFRALKQESHGVQRAWTMAWAPMVT